jgi:hypothetical protein
VRQQFLQILVPPSLILSARDAHECRQWNLLRVSYDSNGEQQNGGASQNEGCSFHFAPKKKNPQITQIKSG